MLRLLLSVTLFCMLSTAQAAITLGATRVIYHGDKKEASIALNNSDPARPYLVQSWITTINGDKAASPFIITPPLFKLEPNTENRVRIAYVKPVLPTDRESLYELNINAIPAVEKSETSRILIATKNVVKLIYRPAGLSSPDALSAYEKLTMTKRPGVLVMNNPTPFYITIGVFSVDGKEMKRVGFVPPFGTKEVSGIAGNPRSVSLKAINDYGGLTAERRFSL
ncbi:molecular chaperone [Serratia fonticola]|uniref:fimbrial biogenesis chaperone n=1 Tax=Serratia fonticola TaxID=47917 RepID=UPI00192D1CA7|nr:molecular chaperone [Serratia fonticola]MBL5825932.1 molecular chaperone [Serratia fonticola]